MTQTTRLTLFLTALVAGCPGPEAVTDGGFDARPDAMACTADADCDDGLFCNGDETCDGGLCGPGTAPDCDDAIACTRDACSEERVRCENTAPDADGDGYGDAACLDALGDPIGNDCADDDASRFPGNAEVCDLEGRDEDCVEATLGARDEDGDGYVSATCCSPGGACGDDCRDTRRSAFPMAPELCNGIDDDCDGTIDEGALVPLYADADRDGFGTGATTMGCPGIAGLVPDGGDCDDTPGAGIARHPAQPEACDGIDNDCNDLVDDATGDVRWYADVDGDGFGNATDFVLSCLPIAERSLLGNDCDDRTSARSPAAPELCNGLDDDCSGVADYRIGPGDFEDDDGDGAPDAACGTAVPDCDDEDASTTAGSIELCDGRDNDCDGTTDEGAAGVVYYRDADMDGFGAVASGATASCRVPPGYAALGGDCDDGNAMRSPSATETCNGLDDDCDRTLDEAPAITSCTVPAGATASACAAGRCSVTRCTSGRGDCNGTFSDGCEVTFATDPLHCGSCGRTCGPNPPNGAWACTAGTTCTLTCPIGRSNCNGSPADGCETASASCTLCSSGSTDCDGDGTCEDLTGDAANCGACGRSCGPGGLCLDGRCDRVVELGTGAAHTCVRREGGSVLCWGSNGSGELGVAGSPPGVVTVALAAPAIQLAVGASHTCALLVDGRVECWGLDTDGQLGDGATVVMAGTHAIVTLPEPGTTLVAGTFHTFVIATPRRGYGWGRNAAGQVNGIPGADVLTPSPVTFVVDVNSSALAAGDEFTCTTEYMGTTMCVGALSGFFASSTGVTTGPTTDPGPSSFVAGARHVCAGLASRIECFGDTTDGQLGTSGFGKPYFETSSLVGASVGTAGRATCAIDGTTVRCVGDGRTGALGTGSATVSFAPVAVGSTGRPIALSRGAAADHVCAADDAGHVWCWGPNSDGRITGTPSAMTLGPTRVPGL